MNEKVHALINQQINKEFYSAYLYLKFSNYFEEVGLDGFANWYKIQAQEERDHAMLFYQYLQNENQKVTLEGVHDLRMHGLIQRFLGLKLLAQRVNRKRIPCRWHKGIPQSPMGTYAPCEYSQ